VPNAVEAYVVGGLFSGEACVILLLRVLGDLTIKLTEQMAGMPEAKYPEGQRQERAIRVQHRLIAAAKVERVACASEVACQQLRTSIVHVFNGYVATLFA
jgi:hypothetical protein